MMLIKKHAYIWIALIALGLASVVVVLGAFEKQTETTLPLLSVEWPREAVVLNDMQTFQVDVLGDVDHDEYRLTWKVSDSQQGELSHDGSQYVGLVSVSHWDWQRDSRYPVFFMLHTLEGELVASTEVVVFVDSSALVPEGVAVEIDVEESFADQVTSTNQASVIRSTPLSMSGPTPSPMPVVAQSVAPVLETVRPLTVTWQSAPASQTQNFVFTVGDTTTKEVTAFWQTDGGHRNMIFNRDAENRFVTGINFFGWQWKGKGPYPISFAIADNATGLEIARVEYEMVWEDSVGGSRLLLSEVGSTSVPVRVATASVLHTAPAVSEVVAPPTPSVRPTTSSVPVTVREHTLPVTASGLYVQRKPAVESGRSRLTNPQDIQLIDQLLKQPSAIWLNGNQHDNSEYINSVMREASTQNVMPVFVLYNIPYRDCGSYSSGGASSPDAYRSWIDRISSVLGSRQAVVIIEPDALAQLNCAPADKRGERVDLLRYAVDTFARTTQARTYVDAGHPYWVNAEEMANRLRSAGVENATGFSLNVSNFTTVADNVRYGSYLSSLLNGKRYVIDTSRNGNGPDPERNWCNPQGRAVGPSPRLVQSGSLDAYLWIKYPGESDGSCNGGPTAGVWWPEYALNLIRNSTR